MLFTVLSLLTLLSLFPLYYGCLLSLSNPDIALHVFHPVCTHFFIALVHSPSACTVRPIYLLSSVLGTSTPPIFIIGNAHLVIPLFPHAALRVESFAGRNNGISFRSCKIVFVRPLAEFVPVNLSQNQVLQKLMPKNLVYFLQFTTQNSYKRVPFHFLFYHSYRQPLTFTIL